MANRSKGCRAPQVLHQLSASPEVIHVLRMHDCVRPLVEVMRATPSFAAAIVATLTNMMSSSDLVEKALQVQLVPLLLRSGSLLLAWCAHH